MVMYLTYLRLSVFLEEGDRRSGLAACLPAHLRATASIVEHVFGRGDVDRRGQETEERNRPQAEQRAEEPGFQVG